MDVFNYCWVTLVTEAKKCNVLLDQNTCNVTNSNDECFDKPLNRVSYLYKFGTFNILYLQRCLIDFTRKTPGALKILDKLCSTKNLNICSLSTGPGIDIIGLLYSLNSLGKTLKKPVDLKLLHKYGSWRNMVHELTNADIVGLPPLSTCKLIQCDILTKISSKAKSYMKNADVVLMFQPFTSVKATKSVISNVIKNILLLLKPGALVFFISDKEKFAYFTELHTRGSFLYGPTFIRLENVPYNEKVVEIVGTKPVCSGSAYFAVWQKSINDGREKSAPSAKEENNVSKNPTLVKQLSTNKANTTMHQGTVHSLLNLNKTELNKSLQIGQNLQNEHLVSRSSGGLLNMSNDHLGYTGFVSRAPLQSNTSSNNNAEPVLGVPNESIPVTNQIETCDSVVRQSDSEHSVKTLLRSFDSLLSTIENYILEKDPHKYSQKNDRCCMNCPSRSYQEMCVEKINRPCRSSACSHSACNHCVALHSPHAPVCSQIFWDVPLPSQCSSNQCQDISLQNKPCLVIPTHCLRNDTLTHILSLVNKNK